MQQEQHLGKGKLSVLALALSAALATMAAAHAQTTITTTQTWNSGNFTVGNGTIINVSSGNAVTGSGTRGTLTNFGTISSANMGVNNSDTADLVINSGLITSTGNVALYNVGNIANVYNGGTITSTGTLAGIAAMQNDGTITVLTNAGNISASNRDGFINYGPISTLTNNGSISGGVSGLDNHGLIGTLTNSGVVSGGVTALNNYVTVSTLNNSATGTIIGATASAIDNGGLITSLNNDGVISGGTAYSTTLHVAGIYNQSAHTIGTLTNSSTGTISGYKGIYNAGIIGALDNSGSITGSHSGGIVNASTGTIGSLLNSGIISNSTAAGINNSGLITSLSNSSSGTISGASWGINNNGTISTLTNNGTIIGSGSSAIGIYNHNNIATLTNNGLVSGSYAALYLGGGTTLTNFTNAGTVAGDIYNESSNGLTISGGSGTNFGTLAGYGGGIGNIYSSSDLTFGSGNQLLNDNIIVNSGSGTVINTGTLQVNNPLSITGNYMQGSGATLLIGVVNPVFNGNYTDSGYGHLIVSGNATLDGSTITLKSASYALAQGQRYVVVSALGTVSATATTYSASGYTVTGTTQSDSSNASYTDLVLTLGNAAGSSGTSPINSATTSNAVSSLAGLFKYSGTDASLLAVFNPAAALDSTASANKAGAQLSPSAVTSAASKAIDSAAQAISNVVTSHLDGFRIAQTGSSGVATGERSADIQLWGQVFGGSAAQGLRENISGYHANYRGLLIGADGLVSDAVRIGALVSASKTSVASDGDNTGSSASINNYGLTAYGTYTDSPWYVNVLAGAMRQQYSTVRTISYTGFSGVADGNFNGSQYISSVQAGYPLSLDAWLPGATLTPIAGLSYSTLRQNGYTETGGSGAALSVNASSTNSLKSELGVKLERAFDLAYGKLLPSLQLGWRHEYKDSATQTGAIFAADTTGSTAFVTRSATPIANLGVLNLGMTLAQRNNLTLSGKYTLEAGGGYIAQTGSVQLRWQY